MSKVNIIKHYEDVLGIKHYEDVLGIKHYEDVLGIKHYEDVLGIKHPDNGGDRNKWVSGMHKHITQKHWDTRNKV